jgi:hypothetical protein
MKPMHTILKRFCFLILLLSLPGFLLSCSSTKTAANPDLVWTVGITKYEIKNKLQGVKTVQQYSGSYDEVIQQAPASGNVYLIMELAITKQGQAATSFDWSKLSLQDEAGNNYQRDNNDTYLESYKYKPRMTGLEIRFGTNKGWVCFEIPEKASNGKLTLKYSGDGSAQEISVK